MNRRIANNQKRKICRPPHDPGEIERCQRLALAARYGGNPVHKRNPGDFGLDPPSRPKPEKTLCDGANIFQRSIAVGLLQEGMRRGLFSTLICGDWPKYVWSVTADGIPVEAIMENEGVGAYHGYPMRVGDPLGDEVLRRWNNP